MFQFHKNKDRYFAMQKWVTEEYVIPFIESESKIDSKTKVLEIGCAEAGVLAAFLDKGCDAVGIELNANRAKIARTNLKNAIDAGKADIITENIYNIDIKNREDLRFDLIVLKDVIEHIPDQQRFVGFVKLFLKPDGMVFFGYPPWQMPFGGHQQVCKSKLLSILPWFHLLPAFIYRGILKLFGESEGTIKELLEIKDTGISIGKMHKILSQKNMEILKEEYWAINPIYSQKFNLAPRKHNLRIPFLKNFYTTCHYLVFKPK